MLITAYGCRVYRYDPRRATWPVLIFEGTLHVSEQFDYGHLPLCNSCLILFCSSSNLPPQKKICLQLRALSCSIVSQLDCAAGYAEAETTRRHLGAFDIFVHLFAGVGCRVVKYYEHSAIPVSEILQKCNYALGIRLLMELHIKRTLSQRPYDLYALF